MKLPQFEYAGPTSVAEAVALLAAGNGMARPISGGQSLIPLLAFRLTSPSLLVDLRGVAELEGIRIDANGVRLGARVRWCDILSNTDVKAAQPLLAEAISHVAHYQIRNRGTVGGSLAHADPAAEMVGIAVTCDAAITLVGPSGARVVAAADFVLGSLSTALQPDELITEIQLPKWAAGRRWGFQELARRRGDFALAGVAVFYDEDGAGQAVDTHIGVIGVGARPQRLTSAEAALNGRAITEETIMAAANAVAETVDPPEDFHATAAYRRALAATLTERALKSAAAMRFDSQHG
jgi:carbon-monoxide dehydrogenase medium subunit